MSRRWPHVDPASLALALVVALGACDDGGPPEPPPCIDDQCDSVGSKADLLAELAGHDDPVATFLRAATSERGTLNGDYRDVLEGVGAELGCTSASTRSFVVLSNTDLIPKTVFAECADDPQAASRFFAAVPALHAAGGGIDVDPQVLHLSAWDETAATYRTYSTRPDPAGEMGVNVSPRFCLGCHGGPHQTGFWQPLMNEMTNPWSGWNAEPGFRSQLFDELLDPDLAGSEVYRELTADGLLDSASNLEPIVRAGIDRMVGARLRTRDDTASLDDALTLLRPLFCDETINFVSEIHGGGEIRSSTVIDRAVAPLFAALGSPLAWATDTLRLPAADDPAAGLTLVPVRGESTSAVELGLVARRALEAGAVLRVRALDYGRPVMSEFRCDLWQRGAARIDAGSLDDALAGLAEGATTADVLPLAFDEIMQLEVDGGLLSLRPPVSADVIAFADASSPTTAGLLAAGQTADLALSFAALAERFAGLTSAVVRDDLATVRQARACEARDAYAVTPIYVDLDCE